MKNNLNENIIEKVFKELAEKYKIEVFDVIINSIEPIDVWAEMRVKTLSDISSICPGVNHERLNYKILDEESFKNELEKDILNEIEMFDPEEKWKESFDSYEDLDDFGYNAAVEYYLANQHYKKFI